MEGTLESLSKLIRLALPSRLRKANTRGNWGKSRSCDVEELVEERRRIGGPVILSLDE